MLVDKTDKCDKVLLICFFTLIFALAIVNIYFAIQMYQVTEEINTDVFDTHYVDYNVWEFSDKSWFICSDTENMYVFQPVELGDWDYEVENREELSKIMATYFINKYHVEEEKAIQEINKILEEVK